MKLHWVGLVAVSFLGLTACEEGADEAIEQPAAEQPAEPAPPPAPVEAPKPPEITPAQVCTELTTAAKAPGDDAKLATLVEGDLAAEGQKDHLVAAIGGAICGEPKVEADKATVPVTLGEGKKAQTKELQLVKAENSWKLDLAAFTAKYPIEQAKGKKGKKAKGKGKKKG